MSHTEVLTYRVKSIRGILTSITESFIYFVNNEILDKMSAD